MGCATAGTALVALLLLATSCRSGPPAAYVPGLGEIMTLTQMRHAKLWFAGEAENWPLADYELDEIEEGFADATRFHPTHKSAPSPLTVLVPEFIGPPLQELRTAVQDRDRASFERGFDALTAACNGCHRAAGFSFNVVTRPTANPYPNQQFRVTGRP